MSEEPARGSRWRAALAGIVALVTGFGIAQLLAGLFAPTAGPLVTIGAWVISITPGWAKEALISVVGKNDKPFLLTLLSIIALAIAASAGVLEQRRPPLGRVIVFVIGIIGVVAIVTTSSYSPADALPPVVGMGVAALLLPALIRRSQPATKPTLDGVERRQFVTWIAASAAVGLLGAVAGQVIASGATVAEKARAVLKLPKPAVAGPVVPASANLGVAGLEPYITPNSDFYRIDTALQVPQIDPDKWSLKITGMVDNDVTIDYAELLKLPLEESTTTLMCVSDPVGGNLISNATWLGYPIRHLLERAGPSASADMVLSTSIDGFTAGTPLSALTDERNAILAVGMNGVPLPVEHGFPVRMVVPGLYGYVSATKWVVEMKVTTYEKDQAYWTVEGWSPKGPVKTGSRVDVPRDGATVDAGAVVIAGIAWHQHLGIAGVQVKIDDGDWQDATLGGTTSSDTWVQWMYEWRATAGTHVITARATDATGAVQTSKVQDVLPDGATGLPSIRVQVS